MKGKYTGPMSVDEFFQALYQDREFFTRFAISHIRHATLYFTPCDERGENVTVYHDSTGEEVEGYNSAGPYRCAADFYDNSTLAPEPVTGSAATARGSSGKSSQGSASHAAAPFAPI